jgi:hypothetical protein
MLKARVLEFAMDSAELPHRLKVFDRGGGTPKTVRNRSASVRAGLWALPWHFWLGFVRYGGRSGLQIGDCRPDP